MKKIQVVTIVIVKNGRFLLGKRNSHKSSAAGYWCPISGRIEAGETEIQAIAREAFEEVGLTLKVICKLREMDSNDGSATLHWWLVEIIGGEAFLKNDEHTEIGWYTIEEMFKLTPIFIEDIDIFKEAQGMSY